MLDFEKYEGLGNDFLVVEAGDASIVDADRARRLCDRRFGVGGDGVLLVLPPRTPGAAASMRVINSDGSIPEMCGNGLRCVALHLARTRQAGEAGAELTIDTDAGVRRCTLDGERITVDMGPVRVLEDILLDVGDARVGLTLADAGNPHAVALSTFAQYTHSDFERLGPQIATHSRFAHGTNAEFAVLRDGAIDLVVWERGAGATLACGTGACATVAVAVAKGLAPADREIRVNLPGGPLAIRMDSETGHAILRGPARHVFSGRTT